MSDTPDAAPMAPRTAVRTSLIYAVLNGKTATALGMIPTSDVRARDSEGNDALTIACICSGMHRSLPTVVEALIAAGSEVNGANNDGSTPLMAVARNYQTPLLKVALLTVLLDVGADPMARDQHGKTALHHVQPRGDDGWDAVRVLAERVPLALVYDALRFFRYCEEGDEGDLTVEQVRSLAQTPKKKAFLDDVQRRDEREQLMAAVVTEIREVVKPRSRL